MYTLAIEKEEIKRLFDSLAREYSVIGPRLKNEVIIMSEIVFNDIPAGHTDTQRPGYYRINEGGNSIFSFVNGPDSPKRFFHSPHSIFHKFQRSKRGTAIAPHEEKEKRYAFFGVRACDMRGLEIHDRVFSGIPYTEYHQRRKDSFIVALNCTRSGENCFCASMDAGPEVRGGYDIALTELDDIFTLETGTERGKQIMEHLVVRQATATEIEEKEKRVNSCKTSMIKKMKIDDLPGFLYRHFDSPLWHDFAVRCLACGNCTQVCPTCFCSSAFDHIALSDIQKVHEFSGQRVRKWDSCYSGNFARVHGGNFRPSRWARHRHWLNHKLGYWIEQFGITGCVGCGRCITWCPVGIDITEELERLRTRVL